MSSHIADVLPITADKLIAISGVTAIAPENIHEAVEGAIAKCGGSQNTAPESACLPLLNPSK